MQGYARLCESTPFFASLAYVCEAPLFASYVSSHAEKNAETSLIWWHLCPLSNWETSKFRPFISTSSQCDKPLTKALNY